MMATAAQARPVHPDHVAAWGRALGDVALGERIHANPRLKARAAERVARHFGIGEPARLPVRPGLLHAVNAVIADRARMERLCGLLALRGLLHRAVSRDDYRMLAAHLPHAELELAASLIDQLPPSAAIRVDPERVGDRVRAAGQAVIAAWHDALDPAVARMVDFAFGEDAFADVVPADDAQEASAIVELAARGGNR